MSTHPREGASVAYRASTDPGRGAARSIGDHVVEAVVAATLETAPPDGTHCLAAMLLVDHGTAARPRPRSGGALGLKPWRQDSFKLFPTRSLVEKTTEASLAQETEVELTPPALASLRLVSDAERRVEIVNEHMRLENAHDFAACIAKFGRPRYEVMANKEVFDGESRVDQFLSENRRAFPDFRFRAASVSPTPDAVLVEGVFTGTHEGQWRGLPATGRHVEFPMCLIFEFEGDVLVNERIYFDLGTPLGQLGVADDPDTLRGKAIIALTHPVTIIRALLRTLLRRVRRHRP